MRNITKQADVQGLGQAGLGDLEQINALHPVFAEVLPLTLEEVFISEMEVAGYDIENILN